MYSIEKVQQYVQAECKKPTSKYGYEPYDYHFVPTVNYALILNKRLGGDREVIEAAAWLHDIGSIISGREDHHLTGAEIAGDKLKELGFPESKIELVKKCILNHRGSLDKTRRSIEEQIIAEADVMANFDDLPGIFQAFMVYEKMSRGEARKMALKKLENKYKQLHFSESKDILKPKYEAARLLLG